MTRFELLMANKSLLSIMLENSISIKEIKYINLILDYKEMCYKYKYKIGYIVSFLAEKYNVAERTVYTIISKMDKSVKV